MTDPFERPFDRHARAFPDLAPPPGGLVRLRSRLDRLERRRARLLALAFVPTLAAAAAVLFVVVRPAPPPVRFDTPALAHPAAPVVAHGAAALAVPLADGVTLYWVP